MSSVSERFVRRWPAVALGIGLLATGCREGAGNDPGAASGAEVLRVIVGGEVTAAWTLADLEAKVAFVTVTIDGDGQTGPLLLDVLAVSGVANWETAEVLGLGEGRTTEVGLDISSSDVDDGWILDVTKQGTLKLAADDLPRASWVRDVREIRVD